MSYQQQNGFPQNQPNFGAHGFCPHGNIGYNHNQNNQQFPGRRIEQGFNQNQGGFHPRYNFFPPHGGNFNPQGFNQQQYQQQPEPEPAHEHPLNFEGILNEKCKICLQNIGENGGYKCKECPIVLCLNCSQKIFYGNKNKQLHQHDLLLQDRNSWTCDICKTSYMDNASFYCNQCDFDVCDKCYLNDNLPQQQFPQPQPQPQFPQPPSQQQFPQSQQPFPQSQQQFPHPQKQFPKSQFQQQYPQSQSQFPQPQQNQQTPFQQPQSQYPQPPFKPNQNQQYGPQMQYPQQQPTFAPQQNISQSQGGFQQPFNQGGNYMSQEQYYNQEDYSQQQYQEQELQPDSDHEHPLNFEEKLNEKCKICLQNIGGNGGYKCKECPITLCLNCSDRIFYDYKNKSIHQHELFLKAKNNWNCNNCKRYKQENASFSCTQCNFDVCDECYIGQTQQGYQNQQNVNNQQPTINQFNQQMQPAYVQTQQQQEEYEPFHEHPLNYEEKINDNCKICLKKIGGKEGYKCKECPIVLCIECLNIIYYGAKKKTLHNHELVLKDRNNWTCNICKKKNGNASFYCPQCDFDACYNCYLEQSNQITQNNSEYHQEVVSESDSGHEHPLYYEENLKQNCKLCLKKINDQKGYKCKKCEIVLCLGCSNKIFFKEKNKSLHKHDLLLKPRKSWKCNKCLKIFKNNASFYCKKCDYDSCVDCYIKK